MITAMLLGAADAAATVVNHLTKTETFGDAAWVRNTGTTGVTADADTGPTGTGTADKLTQASTSTAQRGVTQTLASAPADGTACALSIYAKAGERTWLAITLFNKANSGLVTYFNLSTGAVGNVGAGLTASVTAAGNSYYRCAVTGTVGTGVNTPQARFGIASANGGASFSGGTIGDGIYLWGAQMELGTSTVGTYTANP